CIVWFFCSSRRRHTRSTRDWSSDVCSSDLTSLNANRAVNFSPEASSFCVISYPLWGAEAAVSLMDATNLGEMVSPMRAATSRIRSEERRVGKEYRATRRQETEKNKNVDEHH